MSGEKSPVYVETNYKNTREHTLNLRNNSEYWGTQDGSPSLIEIKGPLIYNPEWRIIQNGILVADAKFILTLASNQRLLVSSYPEDMYARIYNSDGTFSDVSQLGDFTKANYLRVPSGESIMLVTADINTKINITFKEERLLV